MSVRIKICGITNLEDALASVRYGAWALGFVFYRKSPRCITPFAARNIIRHLPPFITPVGVFVNETELAVKKVSAFTGIRVVQFHGDEPVTYCRRFKDLSIIKAFRVRGDVRPDVFRGYEMAKAFLLDAYHEQVYGGTGRILNWNSFKKIKDVDRPIILSGGLTPDNVHRAIQQVHPYAVDVSSGLESSPGKKAPRLIRRFIQQALQPQP